MLRIGVVGMSPGNAHPSSWSAIINGEFDGDKIAAMGYPAVADYLQANKPTLGLPGARVTHVWSQSRDTSEMIAATAEIANVAADAAEMIANVDAVLLCRDDPENHVAMAKPFVDAGLPLFIDKPLCSTKQDLDYFSSEIEKGKFIMSCSSMRYASELMAVKSSIKSFGKMELVTGVGKKDWLKYGIHMLEGIVSVLNDPKPVSVRNVGSAVKNSVQITYEGDLQMMLHLFNDLVPTMQLSFFGQESWRTVEIKNSYAMFRDNIIEFIRSVQEGKSRIDFAKTKQIINVMIAAEESLAAGGQAIML
ncbi:Gfo/Idh/MocA family oxidoreductase [Flavisolibacter ginsenosidimutans]|uniref:Gfo/Idh/MocA family oxidoreductase n=1 Tax=Flavisolibacter ginsenosidimutans TaxID=661481 RepID=A0A5B8UD10_9BACT|nr:Gfo/Idh/MocA family oxidoreductase [Flavisolibacter ginsenosidimutans]QEC54378.1 gfo/Idh/MocA family oxidoreductase [Flavisolibacter ginsenosidimutans]